MTACLGRRPHRALEQRGRTRIRVHITDPAHPHFPEQGELTTELIQPVAGMKMARMTLDHCPHGMAACYVGLSQLATELRPPPANQRHRRRRC